MLSLGFQGGGEEFVAEDSLIWSDTTETVFQFTRAFRRISSSHL